MAPKGKAAALLNMDHGFDELLFFAQVKKRPGLFLGQPSLLSLRDQLLGMQYAFSFCCTEDPLRYFHAFIRWYQDAVLHDGSGYACWWNHMLYISGNEDSLAFKTFFRAFEQYLRDTFAIVLPEAV